MSWSQTEDLYDQMTVLIGSAVRLLRGEAGLFIVSNEAFDPQSSSEYTLYQLNPSSLSDLLPHLQQGIQPDLQQPLVTAPLSASAAASLELIGVHNGNSAHLTLERCSLFIHDPA